MPTLVGILTFISMINTASERLKAKNFFTFGVLVFMSSGDFVLSRVEYEKSIIISGPDWLSSLQ